MVSAFSKMVSAFEKIILLVAAGGPAGGGEAS